MAKQIPQKELDTILEVITRFPDGISLGKIINELGIPISLRNLQYRLAALVQNGYLQAKGHARSRIYLTTSQEKNTFHESTQPDNDNLIPLSDISKKIQKQLSLPIQARTPVGYNRNFLDKYRPNITSYLSDSTKKKLLELGKTDGECPAGTYARQIINRLLIDLS